MEGTHKYTNRLARQKSPYLLQHQHNPVDWYPWGEEAFEKARKENKPILLSIGYSTCHWCHVMERESFEDEATAEYLNKHFVSIKVDREERPDVDKIYMTAVQANTRAHHHGNRNGPSSSCGKTHSFRLTPMPAGATIKASVTAHLTRYNLQPQCSQK